MKNHWGLRSIRGENPWFNKSVLCDFLLGQDVVGDAGLIDVPDKLVVPLKPGGQMSLEDEAVQQE